MALDRISGRTTRLAAIAGVSALALGAFGQADAQSSSSSFVVMQSHRSFHGTVSALKSATSSNHMMIMGTEDQAKVLSMTGLHLAGAESFLVGNPVVGKKAFKMNPAATVVLPARISVWVDHGKTYVGYLKPSAQLKAVDPKFGMMAGKLDHAFSNIAHQATK